MIAMSRAGWQVAAAGIALGLAGYAWQGRPGLPASPAQRVAPAAPAPVSDEDVRKSVLGQVGGEADVMSQADAYMRAGHPELSFRVYQLGLEKNPQSPALWSGMGVSLIEQAGGQLTPAAEHAFRKALAITPDHPGTLFFYGLSLAISGRNDEARDRWSALLRVVPDSAPQKKLLIEQIAASGVMTRAEMTDMRGPVPSR